MGDGAAAGVLPMGTVKMYQSAMVRRQASLGCPHREGHPHRDRSLICEAGRCTVCEQSPESAWSYAHLTASSVLVSEPVQVLEPIGAALPLQGQESLKTWTGS